MLFIASNRKRLKGGNMLTEGYQPIKDDLDINNPPKGGSGVPNNNCENCPYPLIKIYFENIEEEYIYWSR